MYESKGKKKGMIKKITLLALLNTNQMWNPVFWLRVVLNYIFFFTLQKLGWYTKDHAPSFSINLKQGKSSEGEKLCVTAGPDDDKRTQQVSHY